MKDFAREDAIVSRLAEAGVPRTKRAGRTVPALSLSPALLPARFHGRYRQWGKRTLDVALVLLTAPISVPLILICAIVLWIESGLPFYTQDRLGKNGKTFRIMKLRTMVRDADAQLESWLAQDPALRAEWDLT